MRIKGFDAKNTSSAIIRYTILTKQLLYGRRVVANILLWTYRWLTTNGGSQKTHYRGLTDFHRRLYIYIKSIVKMCSIWRKKIVITCEYTTQQLLQFDVGIIRNVKHLSVLVYLCVLHNIML